MTARKTQPAITYSPPSDLHVFSVYEHQLDRLAEGSPAALLLNFALFFLGISSSALGTIWSAPPNSDRTFYVFVIVFLVTLIAGLVLLSLWWFNYQSTRGLLAEIKSQKPPVIGVQENPGEQM